MRIERKDITFPKTAMTKQIYLIRGEEMETYPDFRNRVESCLAEFSPRKDILKLGYTITVERPPSVSVIPFRRKKVASVSVQKRESDPIEKLISQPGFSGAYTVTEATPVTYTKSWPDGGKTPGVCLLTLFRKRKDIDRYAFIDRWHNSHTPLSLKIHPLWHYNRNVVDGFIPETAEPWDGIVEEHMRTRPELLNPFKFFGNPLVIVQRMIQVYADTKSFIDYPTIEPYLVSEFILKSLATG
jgi:hypothetical protein